MACDVSPVAMFSIPLKMTIKSSNESSPAGKVGQIQDEPPVPLLQPDQARRPGERGHQLWPNIDHNDLGDDLSKLLWSCRWDSSLSSLGRQ